MSVKTFYALSTIELCYKHNMTANETLKAHAGARLRKHRQEVLRLSAKDFARQAGVSASYLYNVENGTRHPSGDVLVGIARAARLSLDEWILGATAAEALPTHGVSEVPLLSWISAGAMTKEDVRDEALGVVRVAELPPGDWIALEVKGDSMDRISPPSSRIIVNRRDKTLVANACYVIDDGEGNATYKRFRPDPMRFEPVSTNPAHEPIFPDNEPTIVGRVHESILRL